MYLLEGIQWQGVSPSGDLTIERVFMYSIIIALIIIIISVGIPYFLRMILIFSRFIELKAFEKSMKRSVIGTFLSFTPSSIRRIVSICPDVDLFVLKPF